MPQRDLFDNYRILETYVLTITENRRRETLPFMLFIPRIADNFSVLLLFVTTPLPIARQAPDAKKGKKKS